MEKADSCAVLPAGLSLSNFAEIIPFRSVARLRPASCKPNLDSQLTLSPAACMPAMYPWQIARARPCRLNPPADSPPQ